MSYSKEVLSALLKKYEKSKHFSDTSNRRVLLRNEVKIPDSDSLDYPEFVDEMCELERSGFINIEWTRKSRVISRISLDLSDLKAAYKYADFRDKKETIADVCGLISKSLAQIPNGWIKQYLDSELEEISSKSKLVGLWNEDLEVISDVLKALKLIYTLNGKEISVRAASVSLYSDSKRFERCIKKYIVSITLKNHPLFVENDVSELDDRDALAQVGIILMPEVFEFCGNLRINFKNGTVDYSPIRSGSCISGNCLNEVVSVDLTDIDRILFIENKTNYSEFCLNNKDPRLLVIWHGGLYSPARGKFFKLISNAVASQKALFWADIDLGGFNMFVRLKKNIFPNLKPLNMDIKSFEKHKAMGLERGGDYLKKLSKLKDKPEYSVFFDVIDAINETEVTVEQESFLIV